MNPTKTLLFSFLIPASMFALVDEKSKNFEAEYPISFQDTGSNVIADGAKPKLVSNQFEFTEGPAVDKQGNIFFTDQPNDKIWKFDTEGKLSLFLDKTGRSNGMYFDKKGNLITAADENNELWSISPDKKITIIMKT